MTVNLQQIKAILYLHLLRTWRYKYSFINSTINIALWITIFVLSALVFAPEEQLAVIGPSMFWGIFIWNIVSNSVWYISGWSNFFLLSTGLLEEHIIHGIRIMKFLLGRIITILVQLALATLPIYYIIRYSTGTTVSFIENPIFILLGLTTVTFMALSYALLLAAIAIRTNVPGPLLDISNFFLFIIGGIAVPIASLPEKIRIITILIPYSHASEIVRYGATGMQPYLGLYYETIISITLATIMTIISYYIFRQVEDKYIRTKGIKGVGRM